MAILQSRASHPSCDAAACCAFMAFFISKAVEICFWGCHVTSPVMLGGLIGRSEAIDLHRSPAAPMVRCWDLGTIWDNEIAPPFVQILRMFSSWIGDAKQVHVVVVERESAFRTVIKEAMLQSAVINTYVPIKSKMESSFLSLFSGFLRGSSALHQRYGGGLLEQWLRGDLGLVAGCEGVEAKRVLETVGPKVHWKIHLTLICIGGNFQL